MAYSYARKEGIIRLIHTDHNNVPIQILGEWRTYLFPGTVNSSTGAISDHDDPTTLPKLIKKAGLINALKEDDKLVLEFYSDDDAGSNGVLMGSKSYVRLPVTIQNTRTGFVYESIFNASDIGFTADDKVAIKDTPVKLAELTIPSQARIKLGIAPKDIRVDGAFSFIIVERTGTAS